MRKALLHAPVLSDLYRCPQGRHLSDLPSLIESVKSSAAISSADMHALVTVLIRSLADANLLEVVDGGQRVIGACTGRDGVSVPLVVRNSTARDDLETADATALEVERLGSLHYLVLETAK